MEKTVTLAVNLVNVRKSKLQVFHKLWLKLKTIKGQKVGNKKLVKIAVNLKNNPNQNIKNDGRPKIVKTKLKVESRILAELSVNCNKFYQIKIAIVNLATRLHFCA